MCMGVPCRLVTALPQTDSAEEPPLAVEDLQEDSVAAVPLAAPDPQLATSAEDRTTTLEIAKLRP